MEKEFNITGTCIPEMHYMIDTSIKLDKIIDLIERGKYFIINRPRQYGKTTTLYLLDKKLRTMDKYLSIKISFESIDTESYKEAKLFLRSVMKQIKNYFRFSGNKNMYDYIEKVNDKIDTMDAFSDFVTDMVEYTNKRIVIIIDEVDKSSNNQLFLDFLGVLRNKYLLKNQGEDYSFHSVILAGVHDVKSLKAKIRPEDEQKYNSPWNIAVNFEVDLSFKAIEIETMLKEYAEERKISMDYSKLSDKLYYYTSGYPFLVSRLCQIVDEKLLKPDEKLWTVQHIDESVKYILKETNTLFEDLGKNLENNVELYEEVYSIVIDGEIRVYNNLNPIINLGTIYGIFKEYDNKVMIHNRIYEQLIYNYMISKTEAKVKMGSYNFRDNFINNDNELDFNKILLKFQQFIKEQYSDIEASFLEREGRLIFLAFLKPIINGIGFDFKEVQISQEKRLDVVVTYGKNKYVVELKIWHGEEYHKKGLLQLCDYLKIQDLNKGYLLIYNFNKNKEYKNSSITLKDKDIFMVWV